MAGARARLRWRDYRTAKGRRPVKEFLDDLTDEEAAAVVAAMKEVAEFGLERARHLRRDIHEVRAFSERRDFRLLFAQEASSSCFRSRCSPRRLQRPRKRSSSSQSPAFSTGEAEADAVLSSKAIALTLWLPSFILSGRWPGTFSTK